MILIGTNIIIIDINMAAKGVGIHVPVHALIKLKILIACFIDLIVLKIIENVEIYA